jgi:site-specific recombinase XerD
MPQQPVRAQRNRSDRAEIVPIPKARDSWEAAVAGFLADCRRRNLSTATLENYQWWLNGPRLTSYRQDNGVRIPADMTAVHVKAFEGALVESGLRPSSVDSFHRHIKNFLGFCLREGMDADESVLRIAGPRLGQEEPETFTVEEEQALVASLKDRPRDRMLVELMLRTGLRLSEVASLEVDDIILDDPRGAFVRVRQGKGRKDRAVPLDTPKDRLSSRLQRYIQRTRPPGRSRALFLSERARTDGGEPGPLTAAAIQVLFKRLSRDTGIHVNPHKFRHTFATRALSAGVDVMALQKALGHTTLAMVSRYVHYQKDDLLGAWRLRRD